MPIKFHKNIIKRILTSILIFVVTAFTVFISPSKSLAIEALPEGDSGIASRYPLDSGITSDPSVILADDFESDSQVSDLNKIWTNVFHTEYLRIATEPENVYSGQKSVEFTLPQGNSEIANTVEKVISQERDVLFLRFYSKFDPNFNIAGSSHNGAGLSAHFTVNGKSTAGVPADGTNKFAVFLENWLDTEGSGSPGKLNIYIYHPEQRDVWGDHFYPTGIVSPYTNTPFDFGPDFISRPDFTPQLGRWYCYELMVKANTPGQRDGRIAIWVDGKLAADFQNLRLRDIPSLKIDRFGLSFHSWNSPNTTHKWYDNVVAATSYIGPLYKEAAVSPGITATPTLSVVPSSTCLGSCVTPSNPSPTVYNATTPTGNTNVSTSPASPKPSSPSDQPVNDSDKNGNKNSVNGKAGRGKVGLISLIIKFILFLLKLLLSLLSK